MAPAAHPTNHSCALLCVQNNHKTTAVGRPTPAVEHFQAAETNTTFHRITDHHLVSTSQLQMWGKSRGRSEETSVAGWKFRLEEKAEQNINVIS